MSNPHDAPTSIQEPLTLAGLLATAEKATGLSDWGEDRTFEIGLNKLAEALEAMNPSPEFRANVHNRLQQTHIVEIYRRRLI